MKEILAMIMAGGNGERLHPLTTDRAKPAVPFGGIYRLIDFTLSNCINSGVRRIVVLTQYRSLSLHRHLSLGWNILNPQLDEYILPIPPQMRFDGDWYKGTADCIYQNLNFADTVNHEYFLVLSADHIYTMDYSKMLMFHKEKRADVTVATTQIDQSAASEFGIMKVDEEGKIVGFEEKPKRIMSLPHSQQTISANMGVYIFNNDILREFLEDDAHKDTHHDFGKNIIPEMIPRVSVFAYDFRKDGNKRPEYWRDVGTLDAYFEANMDLIGPDPEFSLYNPNWPIHTHQGQYPPVEIVSSNEFTGKKSGVCLNSILSGGCIISGGRVENSVLSPQVQVHSYSRVSESVLMEGVEVGRFSKIKKAIVCEGVKIPPGTVIGYNEEDDKKRFFVSNSGIVVIFKDNDFPSLREDTVRLQRLIDGSHLRLLEG